MSNLFFLRAFWATFLFALDLLISPFVHGLRGRPAVCSKGSLGICTIINHSHEDIYPLVYIIILQNFQVILWLLCVDIMTDNHNWLIHESFLWWSLWFLFTSCYRCEFVTRNMARDNVCMENDVSSVVVITPSVSCDPCRFIYYFLKFVFPSYLH